MKADKELLTSLYLWPDGIHEAISIVRIEDFSQESDRRAFRAMSELSEAGKPVDALHLVQKFQHAGIAEDQAINEVSLLMDGAPMQGRVKDYAVLVHEEARKRRLAVLMEACKLRAESLDEPDEIMQQALEGLWELQADRAGDEVAPVKNIMPGVLDEAAALRNSEVMPGISTGIGRLDRSTRGIRPSELWIVGALPGRGKTSMGLQIAAEAARTDVPTLIFSMEMTRQQVLSRILGMSQGCEAVGNPRAISPDRWHGLIEYAAEVSTWPLYVDDSSQLSPIELSVRARMKIKQYGVRLIIVDYLQLMKGQGRELRERVGNAANGLRQLAKDTGVPVVAMSQLRRPGDINDRPSMIDLKESGDIEAHANTVLLLYLPIADDNRPTFEDEIIIGKQRNGPLGMVPVYFDRKTLRFNERETHS